MCDDNRPHCEVFKPEDVPDAPKRIEEGRIAVPRDQLMQLIELAEEILYIQHIEFSTPPTDKDRDLVLSLYRLVGKEIPPFFSRTFGWRLD